MPCQNHSVTEVQICGFLNPSSFQLFRLKTSLVPLQRGLYFILNIISSLQLGLLGNGLTRIGNLFPGWNPMGGFIYKPYRTVSSSSWDWNWKWRCLSPDVQWTLACLSVRSAPWASNRAQEIAFRCMVVCWATHRENPTPGNGAQGQTVPQDQELSQVGVGRGPG